MRQAQEKDERKVKRQEIFERFRIPYSPSLFFDMKREKEPSGKEVVTRTQATRDFLEDRRKDALQQRKEGREVAHFKKRNTLEVEEARKVLRNIFLSEPVENILFSFEKYPDTPFLHLEQVLKLRRFFKNVIGKMAISNELLRAMNDELKEIQKELKLSDRSMIAIYDSMNTIFKYPLYFLHYLPAMLSEWFADLKQNKDTSKGLEKYFKEFKEYGFPAKIILTLPVYMNDFFELYPSVADSPMKERFISEVVKYNESLA